MFRKILHFCVDCSQDERANACKKGVKDQCTVEHFSSFSPSMCCIRNYKWNVFCVTLVLHQGTHVARSHLCCNCVTICDFSMCKPSPTEASLSDSYSTCNEEVDLISMRNRTLKYISDTVSHSLWSEIKGELKTITNSFKTNSRGPMCSKTLACSGLQHPMQSNSSISTPNAHRFEFLES